MGATSVWHWIILLLIVVLLFGRGKISDLMGEVAQGIKSFKKGMQDDDAAKAEAETSDQKPEDPKIIDHDATETAPAATTADAPEATNTAEETASTTATKTAASTPKAEAADTPATSEPKPAPQAAGGEPTKTG